MSMTINLSICNKEFSSVKSPDPLVLQCHVNYFSCFITTTTKPMVTKPGTHCFEHVLT